MRDSRGPQEAICTDLVILLGTWTGDEVAIPRHTCKRAFSKDQHRSFLGSPDYTHIESCDSPPLIMASRIGRPDPSDGAYHSD